MIATALSGGLAYTMFDQFELYGEKGILLAMMFGALISATDPVAVVALLKESGASKVLGTIIEGEALLNDGVAVIVFELCKQFSGIVNDGQIHGHHSHGDDHGAEAEGQSHRFNDPYEYLDMSRAINSTNVTLPVEPEMSGLEQVWWAIVNKIFVAFLMGMLSAKMTAFLLYKVFDDMLIEVSFPLIMCYMVYYIAELAGSSGVLACVIFGLILDRNSICTEHHEFLHKFFQMLAYLANTLIFLMVGLLIFQEMQNHMEFTTLISALGYYLLLTLIRFVAISACMFFISWFKKEGGIYQLGLNEVLIMTWGGLRGAVSLCLAINILPASGATETYKAVSGQIFLLTTIEVMMTLLLNASTVSWCLKKLGMLDVTASQHATMMVAIDNLDDDTNRSIVTFKFDPYLSDARWSEVVKRTDIAYPYEYKPSQDEITEELTRTNSIIEEDSAGEASKQLIKMIRKNATSRALKSLKMNYGKQYADGTINDRVFHVLEHCVYACGDEERFIAIDDIKPNWKVSKKWVWLKSTLERWIFDERVKKEACPHTNMTLKRLWRWLTTSSTFDNIFQAIVAVNIVFIVIEFYQNDENPDPYMYNILTWASIIFFILFTIEFIVKWIGLTFKQYWADHWNKMDFVILIITFFDVLMILLTMYIDWYCSLPSNNTSAVCKDETSDSTNLTLSLRLLRLEGVA